MPCGDRVAAAVCITLLGSAMRARGDPAHASGVHCQEAIVNPVSGNAECVRPRGAPVDPPPPRSPPTKAACRQHRALGLKECRRTHLHGSEQVQTDAVTPPK
jgi:hypothetical protein